MARGGGRKRSVNSSKYIFRFCSLFLLFLLFQKFIRLWSGFRKYVFSENCGSTEKTIVTPIVSKPIAVQKMYVIVEKFSLHLRNLPFTYYSNRSGNNVCTCCLLFFLLKCTAFDDKQEPRNRIVANLSLSSQQSLSSSHPSTGPSLTAGADKKAGVFW